MAMTSPDQHALAPEEGERGSRANSALRSQMYSLELHALHSCDHVVILPCPLQQHAVAHCRLWRIDLRGPPVRVVAITGGIRRRLGETSRSEAPWRSRCVGAPPFGSRRDDYLVSCHLHPVSTACNSRQGFSAGQLGQVPTPRRSPCRLPVPGNHRLPGGHRPSPAPGGHRTVSSAGIPCPGCICPLSLASGFYRRPARVDHPVPAVHPPLAALGGHLSVSSDCLLFPGFMHSSSLRGGFCPPWAPGDQYLPGSHRQFPVPSGRCRVSSSDRLRLVFTYCRPCW